MSGEKETPAMSQGRGLLTENEREAIAGESSDSYRYKTRSFFRDRLDELEQDVETLAEYDEGLLEELRDVVCKQGRHIYCPLCGEEFDIPTNAVNHLTGPTTHNCEPHEIREVIPKWWYKEQDTLENYVGKAGVDDE